MGRTSRRESEDHSAKKRGRRSSSSPRRSPSDKYHRKRDDKRDEKREEKRETRHRRDKSPKKSRSASPALMEEIPHVQTRRMSASQNALVADTTAKQGDFKNFPEITQKSRESLIARGITHLFPVQYESFYHVWDRKDLIVRDLTGSGKTLGFALPMVEYLRKNKCFGTGKPQGVVLAPTRELALQVSKEMNALKHYDNEYNVLTVYGGVSIEDQTYQLRRGVDIFVGTTGRVLDHIERKNFNFTDIKFIILDEADQMLKLGFKEDVEKVMRTIKEKGPKDIQVLLFSATVPKWVKNIAENFLAPNFTTIDLAHNLKNKTSKTVKHLAINCPYHNRIAALADILICYGGVGQTIVFCSTKNEANSLLLSEKIKKDIEVMHGDIAQNQREVTLRRFKENKFSVLVATDVASRGLDIPNVDLVIQVEPPKDVETYIHRAGRTARAGRGGTCITFYSKKHQPQIQAIEQRAGIVFQKVGIPQPEDVIKASSRDIVKNLDLVNQDITLLFEETAQQLIEKYNDPKKALMTTLAFLSGHYKGALSARSLLTGQENYITMEIKFDKSFMAMSFVWSVIRKHVDEDVVNNIRGMRMFKDQCGAVFDVPEENIEKFEDIFTHLKESQRINFEVNRAKTLPELKEEADYGGQGARGGYGGGGYGGNSYGGGGYGGDRSGGYGNSGGYGRNQSQGGYGNRGGSYGGGNSYGGSSGGYGGSSGGYGGQQRSGGGGGGQNDEKTIFVGNLGFTMREQEIGDIFKQEKLYPTRIRCLQDQEGKFKGAAFIEFDSKDEADKACRLNGKSGGASGRSLRINPASSKPTGR